ncbi:putative ERG25-C-4 methyl sterol oxidase [Cantharellus anzutake]|uniref:putative ERG25-C-4 methyl sterol oxidase n=1 Tax=Cantharellus anzutake TaxID=1750568 RepID=UPI00190583E2|nr:putative ERG25-C-4 methyl sterol oxidase [Cantharellus anzutake]XP_038918634.1 putative ERG25-C-4 methyl sterol oxidase [Cantharellus anzutake]KAF8315796.1 putative ERG25-C-4 methyl sterol oxidase [Cantharellus anzutake]KAF8335411.1 putative ERG25-C-4 methyl sterol oxidase [Cantharellus anzutake]
MFNVTNHITSDVLYAQAGTDFSKLSWLESKWAAWYLWIGNPVLATGIMSFLMHELVYFGRCLPWMVIDAIPYFRKWKLQPNKIPTPKEQWECTKLVLLTHFTIELPQIWFFHPLAESLGMETWQVPLPPWKTIAPQVLLFFILEDAWHYFSHQALHYGPLYRHIHKLHHRYSAPFGLAAEYAHPLEILILGMGTVGGPLLFCYLTRDLHIITVYIWVFLRLHQAVDAHSGYDFPWSLRNIFPLWSGAEHHDFHHMAFTNNYSTSFRYLDYIFGTDNKYRAYKARVAAAAKAGQNRAEVEKRLLEETEREGQLAEHEAEMAGSVLSKTKTL